MVQINHLDLGGQIHVLIHPTYWVLRWCFMGHVTEILRRRRPYGKASEKSSFWGWIVPQWWWLGDGLWHWVYHRILYQAVKQCKNCKNQVWWLTIWSTIGPAAAAAAAAAVVVVVWEWNFLLQLDQAWTKLGVLLTLLPLRAPPCATGVGAFEALGNSQCFRNNRWSTVDGCKILPQVVNGCKWYIPL